MAQQCGFTSDSVCLLETQQCGFTKVVSVFVCRKQLLTMARQCGFTSDSVCLQVTVVDNGPTVWVHQSGVSVCLQETVVDNGPTVWVHQ